MRELVTEQLKKDFSKLKGLKDKFTGRFAKQTKENTAKVIPPAGDKTKPAEETQQEEQEQFQVGEIKEYAKETICKVTNEEGREIPCESEAEAEILSGIKEIEIILRSLLKLLEEK